MPGSGASSDSTSYGYLPYFDPADASIIGQYQANAADKASSLAQQSIGDAMASITKNFTSATQALQPTTAAGYNAQQELNRYLGLSANSPGLAPTAPTAKQVTQPDIMQYIQGYLDPKTGQYSGVGAGSIFRKEGYTDPNTGTALGTNVLTSDNTALVQKQVQSYLQKQYSDQNKPAMDQYQQDLANYNQNKAVYDKYAATGPYTSQQVNDNITNQPGYQAQFDEGINAVQKAASARGLLGSGNMLKDLTSFASQLEGQYYSDTLNRLANQAAQGTQAAGAIANAYSGQGSALAGLQSQLGDTLSNAALSKGNALSQAYQLGSQKYKQVITGQSSSSSGGGLSGLGSVLGSAASIAMKSSKTYKTKGKNAKLNLDKLDELPVEKWKYKKKLKIDESGQEHIGPYAEDFQKVFGVGDGKSIPIVSSIGILYGLVKELNKKIGDK